jgi:hypothetical protein
MTIASALARTAAALAGAAMLGLCGCASTRPYDPHVSVLIVPGVFGYVADDLARR